MFQSSSFLTQSLHYLTDAIRKREKQHGAEGIVMQSHEGSTSSWNVRKSLLLLSLCKYAHSTIHLAHSAAPKDIISGIWEEKKKNLYIINIHRSFFVCGWGLWTFWQNAWGSVCAACSTCWAYCVCALSFVTAVMRVVGRNGKKGGRGGG